MGDDVVYLDARRVSFDNGDYARIIQNRKLESRPVFTFATKRTNFTNKFMTLYTELLEDPTQEDKIDELFLYLDKDKTGKINREEFVSFVKNFLEVNLKSREAKDFVQKFYDELDLEKNGYINKNEFKEYLKRTSTAYANAPEINLIDGSKAKVFGESQSFEFVSGFLHVLDRRPILGFIKLNPGRAILLHTSLSNVLPLDSESSYSAVAIYTNSKLKLSKKTETISFKLDPTLSFPRKEAGDVVSTQRIDLKLNIADDMRVPEELKALLDGDLNRWTETKYENIWWEKSIPVDAIKDVAGIPTMKSLQTEIERLKSKNKKLKAENRALKKQLAGTEKK